MFFSSWLPSPSCFLHHGCLHRNVLFNRAFFTSILMFSSGRRPLPSPLCFLHHGCLHLNVFFTMAVFTLMSSSPGLSSPGLRGDSPADRHPAHLPLLPPLHPHHLPHPLSLHPPNQVLIQPHQLSTLLRQLRHWLIN